MGGDLQEKNVANCQIWYLEKSCHKVNKAKNQ